MYYFCLFGYGFLALSSVLNWILIPKPRKTLNSAEGPDIVVLIPARNEERNLKELLPCLLEAEPHMKVVVFDDESTDGTANVARNEGAIVISPKESLPLGWTGKNRACDQLASYAMSDPNLNWFVFLDADTRPGPLFIPILRYLASNAPEKTGVFSGFPKLPSGKFPEQFFLEWVPWILLSTNPFGIVARTNMGHNRFTNGQFTMWRTKIYQQIRPNETLKGAILEDVRIGRLLAERNIGVGILNLSHCLTTHMYETWREAFDGLSKNSYEILGSTTGTFGLAMLLLFIAFAWMFAGPHWLVPYSFFCANGIIIALASGRNLFEGLAMPINVSIGAITCLRSIVWRRSGKVSWKGRTYENSGKKK